MLRTSTDSIGVKLCLVINSYHVILGLYKKKEKLILLKYIRYAMSFLLFYHIL